MGCCGCGSNDKRRGIERGKHYKQQNNKGCGCSGNDNSCDTPSNSVEGSPLWKWEQIHGKLVNTVTIEKNSDGQYVMVSNKRGCPVPPKVSVRKDCCSLSYRAS